MRLDDQRASDNVEDRRGRRAGGGRIGGGMGLGTIVVVLLISWVTGTNPLTLFQLAGGLSGGGGSAPVEQGRTGAPTDDPQAVFAARVLGSTEDAWSGIFQASGERYQAPTLVLFDDAVQSACGTNSAAVGPFYCPGDQKLYIDLSFFKQLDEQFGAPGDFAQAYVVAHEVGHHIQTLLGISDKVNAARQQAGEVESNRLSVLQELQADCFAGVWANHANDRQLLQPGDVEEGLRAAAAIGDDTLQKRAQGRVSPESWTHGSSEQRVTWLRRGMTDGSVNACDTFGQASRR
ncbi:MAG: neutral zinc metallopeptidase [Vicinamibacterales bacterium]